MDLVGSRKGDDREDGKEKERDGPEHTILGRAVWKIDQLVDQFVSAVSIMSPRLGTALVWS